MTLSKSGFLTFIRGLFEGVFGLLLLFGAGLSANLSLVLFIFLAVYLALLLLEQTDNVFEIVGLVLGALIAVGLRSIDGGSAMAYVLALFVLIVVRGIPSQKTS